MDVEKSNLSDKAQIDLILISKAIDGNEKAFTELLSKYRDTIYYMLLKMVGNSDDADDLTMEAFGKAFKNIALYTPNYAFSTWLFKIATNNCIDFIRRKRGGAKLPIERTLSDGLITIPIHDNNPDPEEALINQQKSKVLREVVTKLKPRYRKLVEMRYFQELSYEEISQQIELPIGTVKAQLFRAKELLYQILKNSDKKI